MHLWVLQLLFWQLQDTFSNKALGAGGLVRHLIFKFQLIRVKPIDNKELLITRHIFPQNK